MKEFEVQIDVTFSGSLFINANSEEEARTIVYGKKFVPSDIRNLHHIDTDIQEVDELGEVEDED